MTSANPLLVASDLPYGLPDYAAIGDEHWLPAFEAAFRAHADEIAAIAAQQAPATFANTLEPLERAGEMLDRVSRAFFTVSAAHATPAIQQVDETIAPLLAAHDDRIAMDRALFARIEAVHAEIDDLGLDGEQRRLVERHRIRMVRAGAALGDADKARLRAINERLAALTTLFEKHLLADSNALAVHVAESDLAGLAPAEIAALCAAARSRGIDDGALLALPLFTGHPLLAALTDRDVRKRILEASQARGRRGDANDNRATLLEIVRLRAERAELLGYASHAAYVTADETARTPSAVQERLRLLAAPAARNAQREKSELREIAGHDVAAHDWAFLSERLRAERLDVDTAALRPWFEAERVLRDGVFHAAERLYGITFSERDDLVGYHPDVRVFDVSEADGSPIGLYLLDLFSRDTKRGGAWMNAIVAQSHLRGTHPVVINNLNVARPAAGEPVLLTLDEVETLFHEFGHALHGLFATVTYPLFAGTAVGRDVVEFPSQVNEMWAMRPEVLENYAHHHDTGAALPVDAAARLARMGSFGQGFATSEYLAAAWLDQAWHALSLDEARAVDDVETFERAALRDIGLDDDAVPPRYSSTYFQHVFAGGYSAAYYSYIWSEVLDADAAQWFDDNGGLTRANGDRFRERMLGVGGAKDPLEAYRDFRGRDADISPLLRRRGLDG